MGRLDVKGARAPYERAGELAAGDADRLEGYGAFEARLGRFELALPALRRAVLLDPINPNAYLTLGDGLYLARRPADAQAPLPSRLGCRHRPQRGIHWEELVHEDARAALL